MNLRSLQNFLVMAEVGSLKGAAEIVNTAQPALTRQLAQLEEEFKAKLFVRHHRGLMLTEAGERLRDHAERIVAEVAKTRTVMSNTAEMPTGTVSLGLPTAMRSVLSSAVISAYHADFPGVTLRVHEAFAHVIEDLLQRRQLDVAILFGGKRNVSNFNMRPLVTEDVYLAGPADAALRLNEPVAVKHLADVPIILISKRNQLRLATEQAMAKHGLAFRPFLEVEGQPLTHDLVKKGIGYMVTPYCAVRSEIESGQLSGAPIRGLAITWSLGINRIRAHAPAVRELVALIERAVSECIANGTWRNVRTDGEARPKQIRRRAARKD
jgi:LysR family nitrogen assimilation transcriptional regulator